MTNLLLIPLLLHLLLSTTLVNALTSTSPWAPAAWRLTLNIFGEQQQQRPDDGPRLVLPIDVVVESETCPEQDTFLGNALLLRPSDSSYINAQGEQTVRLGQTGGWKLQRGSRRGGLASTLYFWLDVETQAARNDVILEPQRIYLSANCWREPELERGARTMAPILEQAQEAQRVLEEQLSHETGDRRLDGVDPLETIIAYKDMAELVRRWDEAVSKLKEAEKILPRDANKLVRGPWPGGDELLVIKPREVSIKQRKLFGDELQVIGSWKAKPIQVQSEA